MKVAVCCIGRQENRYVNEYINHYLSIGVDKIYIYDNNYNGEEYFEDVIPSDFINDKVEIIDFRNKSNCQVIAYQDCYDKHNNEYDWMLFIDCGDEYLYMEGFNNIKDFLKQDKFNAFDLIHINLMNYGDCNKVFYEDKPLKERFHTPILPLDWKKNLSVCENDHVSSIVRGKLKNVLWVATPHTPHGDLKCCDASGKSCLSQSPFLKFDYTYAHFKHYTTKTIEEWLNVKVKRGYPDGNKDYFIQNNPIVEFFKSNEVTKEKIDFLKENGYIS